MTPTAELRFVEREVFLGHSDTKPEWETIRVLQQKWEGDFFDSITGRLIEQWRDVPLVKEEV